jgi:predicted amidophosphoribosyltransferase
LVPANPLARFKRGFDLPQQIARGLGRPVWPIVRRGFGRSQKGRSRADRLAKIAASLRIGPEFESLAARPATIVLLDDVCTTGATLAACATLLRQWGVSEIFCLAVAKDRYLG